MKGKTKWVALAVLVFAIGIAAYLYLRPKTIETVGLEYENATMGIMPGIDIEARQRELQEVLDKSMIAFSINTNPTFESGDSKGNIMIENPTHNAKLLIVEVYLSDTDELVYTSKAIKPGFYVEEVMLDKKLSKGSYPATVYFKGYTEDTQEYIGQTGADIVLHILS